MTRILVLSILMGSALTLACSGPQARGDEDGTAGNAAPAASQSGPGGRLTLSGEIDADFTDVSWTVVEHTPPAGVDVGGFEVWLYDRESGRFKDVLTLSGIPFETPVATALPLGPEIREGTVKAMYVVDAMNPSASRYVALSGTLIFTRHDSKLSGTFEAQMVPADGGGNPASGAREPSLTVIGSFHDLDAIEPG